MYQRFKKGLYLISTLAIAFAPIANADPNCPTDAIKPFVGEWQGKALFIPAQDAQKESQTKDEFVIIDCQTFEVTVNYLDAKGKAGRILNFKASPDESGQVGLFALREGTITEGSDVTTMVGSIRQVQEGTLLGSFSGSMGGKSAFLNELMNLSGENQLVRTVQMFGVKRGGPYIGTRIVNDSRIQTSR